MTNEFARTRYIAAGRNGLGADDCVARFKKPVQARHIAIGIRRFQVGVEQIKDREICALSYRKPVFHRELDHRRRIVRDSFDDIFERHVDRKPPPAPGHKRPSLQTREGHRERDIAG